MTSDNIVHPVLQNGHILGYTFTEKNLYLQVIQAFNDKQMLHSQKKVRDFPVDRLIQLENNQIMY